MDVGLANIARGSMMAPSYNTRANKIAIVLKGQGYFEMACPHVSGGRSSPRRERGHGREEEEEREEEQGGGGGQKSRSYRQVKSRIREGSVIVIPAGHPTALVADKVFLAGTNSALQKMDRPAKLLAFGADEEQQVDRVIGAQKDAVFLRGPQSHRVSSV
ncbi:Globulin-2 [Zea mays]|uniref:Globulin-2 n=1 Tax=Zea mays TaxID=4577 RepID=A0A1D6L7G0_MAIZE|nr:Globulin-2 [Zea mays]